MEHPNIRGKLEQLLGNWEESDEGRRLGDRPLARQAAIVLDRRPRLRSLQEGGGEAIIFTAVSLRREGMGQGGRADEVIPAPARAASRCRASRRAPPQPTPRLLRVRDR